MNIYHRVEHYEIATIWSFCPTKMAISYSSKQHMRGTKCFLYSPQHYELGIIIILILFIYLFIYGCVGSPFLCEGFL